LAAERDVLVVERDALAAERDELEAERDNLREEVRASRQRNLTKVNFSAHDISAAHDGALVMCDEPEPLRSNPPSNKPALDPSGMTDVPLSD